MFCHQCGTQLREGQAFCPNCGRTAGAPAAPATLPPAMPVGTPARTPGRVARHLTVVAVLWMVVSVPRLLGGIAVLFVSRTILPSVLAHEQIDVPFSPSWIPIMVSAVGWFLIVTGVVGVVTSWGLLQRERWARTLTIIFAILSLAEIPVGTALGIYTLWVLMSPDSELEYNALARH